MVVRRVNLGTRGTKPPGHPVFPCMIDRTWLAAYREAHPDEEDVEVRVRDPAGFEAQHASLE